MLPCTPINMRFPSHALPGSPVGGRSGVVFEPGLGSAIFLHVARPDYALTEGCIAVALDDLAGLIAASGPGDRIRIGL